MTIERGAKRWWIGMAAAFALSLVPSAAAYAQLGESCYAQYEHALDVAMWRLLDCKENWLNYWPLIYELDVCEFRYGMEVLEAAATYFRCAFGG